MQEKKTYTKLSDLVDKEFTVEKAWGFSWKKWDDQARKMLMVEKYEPGFRKIYGIETDKGHLDLGSGQLSSLLEAVYKNGAADINGRTFSVKSNGKTGMDIRYFFNAVRLEQADGDGFKKFAEAKKALRKDEEPDEYDEGTPIDLSELPF